MARRGARQHPAIKNVTFTPTGDTAKELEAIARRKAALKQGTMTLGAPQYAYSPEEVIELRDEGHTPYNKRPGSVDSTLVVQIRHHPVGQWVNFTVEETTTSNPHSSTKDKRTASRTISFTLPREMFDAVVAHVNRKGTK